MGIDNVKSGKLIYHLTKVDNFESILENGMLPRKLVLEQGLAFEDIADREIINKRTLLGLDKYIPFHFHPYSAFDVAVKNTYDAQRMIYMCMKREVARFNNFVILPKHPLSAEECVLHDYDEGFELIDWNVLQTKNLNTNYAREVKMAECLTDKIIPIDCFYIIYVPSGEIRQEITGIMDQHSVPQKVRPKLSIMPIWFEY